MKFSARKTSLHSIPQSDSTTRGVNVKARFRDRFHEAAIRVAGRVCTRAFGAGDREAANHAWMRMERLIAARSLPQILAMEYRAGLR